MLQSYVQSIPAPTDWRSTGDQWRHADPSSSLSDVERKSLPSTLRTTHSAGPEKAASPNRLAAVCLGQIWLAKAVFSSKRTEGSTLEYHMMTVEMEVSGLTVASSSESHQIASGLVKMWAVIMDTAFVWHKWGQPNRWLPNCALWV